MLDAEGHVHQSSEPSWMQYSLRERYLRRRIQVWANLINMGRDRGQAAAESTERYIWTAWLLPQPFGDEWKQHVIEMIFSGMTGEELYAEDLEGS